MLKGFSVPLTPDGNSALATLPQWHYSSDCIAIEYWADPDAIAALLPPGVAPDEKSGGRAFFWFLDWQFTASDDELTDPARYQYREAFALVEAIFDGTPINYCRYIFVDNDAAIARGWAQGFPKKLGSVYQTRSFSAPSPAAAPIAKGSRFGASVAAHGERLATARIQLEERVADPSKILGGGPGGIEHFFHQFTGPMTAWWTILGSPLLTPEVQKKLIDSVHAEVGSRSIEDLEAQRDEVLLGLLELRAKAEDRTAQLAIDPGAGRAR
jgi:Acetoacetate decarboxylase (ADC)